MIEELRLTIFDFRIKIEHISVFVAKTTKQLNK
jgi:hypothetical protein